MRDKIQAILERELDKLNTLSQAGPSPLAANDIKSLDTLIKAYRAFVDQPPPGKPTEHPSSAPTEDLLKELTEASQQVHG